MGWCSKWQPSWCCSAPPLAMACGGSARMISQMGRALPCCRAIWSRVSATPRMASGSRAHYGELAARATQQCRPDLIVFPETSGGRTWQDLEEGTGSVLDPLRRDEQIHRKSKANADVLADVSKWKVDVLFGLNSDITTGPEETPGSTTPRS